MSQKLTLSAIAATLAALGATSLMGCGGSGQPAAASPVQAKEVPAATESAPEQAAGTEEKSDTSTAGEGATDKAADAPATAEAKQADAAPGKAPMKNMKKMKSKKAGGAKASCGAGTCG